jgi:putative chitinase
MTVSAIETVRRIAPHARDNYLDAIGRGALFAEHGVTTPLRMAHFLAQALHETGGFRVLREDMTYSAARLVEIFGVNRHSAKVTASEAARLAGDQEAIAERVYGLGNPRKARELGNTQPGDGFRYRGNGVLQTTGRGNHRRMGLACGVDLEGNPDLATAPEHALKPALSEWTENNLNAFADKNDIRTITLRINGGLTGLAEREAWFDKAWLLLKSDSQPAQGWEASDADDRVTRLQEALNDLGANPRIVVDGRYGPATRGAVKQFQAAAGLTADGIAGPVTEAAIKLRLDAIR